LPYITGPAGVAEINGISTATPNSMKIWLFSGEAACQMVMLCGTIYGHMLMPGGIDSANSVSVRKNW
jgi:hypothetical protein